MKNHRIDLETLATYKMEIQTSAGPHAVFNCGTVLNQDGSKYLDKTLTNYNVLFILMHSANKLHLFKCTFDPL